MPVECNGWETERKRERERERGSPVAWSIPPKRDLPSWCTYSLFSISMIQSHIIFEWFVTRITADSRACLASRNIQNTPQTKLDSSVELIDSDSASLHLDSIETPRWNTNQKTKIENGINDTLDTEIKFWILEGSTDSDSALILAVNIGKNSLSIWAGLIVDPVLCAWFSQLLWRSCISRL